ncbi:DotU family type IV/VI secretion system protein, partial [Helicobacter trogontum]|uniref:DotU family type IV/VI secretion system protein n=1 Tax=Helicobacter trogontum TaxID=50960 RepID=UPI0023AA4979
PSKYKDMLEFIYACLILGYKGKYTVDKQGDEKTLQYLLIQALHSYLKKEG